MLLKMKDVFFKIFLVFLTVVIVVLLDVVITIQIMSLNSKGIEDQIPQLAGKSAASMLFMVIFFILFVFFKKGLEFKSRFFYLFQGLGVLYGIKFFISLLPYILSKLTEANSLGDTLLQGAFVFFMKILMFLLALIILPRKIIKDIKEVKK